MGKTTTAPLRATTVQSPVCRAVNNLVSGLLPLMVTAPPTRCWENLLKLVWTLYKSNWSKLEFLRCCFLTQKVFSVSLQFLALPPMSPYQRRAAKILPKFTGCRALGHYFIMLLLKMQLETHTTATHWAPTVWLKAWNVDRITQPKLLVPTSCATAQKVKKPFLWQVS